MLKPENSKGIYTISAQRVILYIGMTNRTFDIRWTEHSRIFTGQAAIPKGQNFMYAKLRQLYESGISISFAALKGFPVASKITAAELEAIEGTLIELYHPPLNTLGVNKPYRYGKDKTISQQISPRTIKKLSI